MVIYQKQHRLAHRQYCVPLSESRLTRFPPPSKKAFFPSSHIFHVNSKCIIKTLFSSKCSSINFRDWLHWKGRDEKISALERGTERVAVLPGSAAAAAEPTQFAGAPLSTAGHSPNLAPPGPDPAIPKGAEQGRPCCQISRQGGGWGEELAAYPTPRLWRMDECGNNSYSQFASFLQPRGSSYLHPCRAKQMMPGSVLMPRFFNIYWAQ